MLRNPFFRVLSAFGALVAGLAACFLLVLTMREFQVRGTPTDDAGSEPATRVEERGDLEFLPVAEEEEVTALGGSTGGLVWRPLRRPPDPNTGEVPLLPLVVQPAKWTFTTADLEFVGPCHDDMGFPAIEFELRREREEAFGDFTESIVHRQLAIVVSGEILTAPVVQERLPGKGIINGGVEGFTKAEVKEILRTLRADEIRGPRSSHWMIFGAAAVAMFLLATALLVLFVVSLSAAPPKVPA